MIRQISLPPHYHSCQDAHLNSISCDYQTTQKKCKSCDKVISSVHLFCNIISTMRQQQKEEKLSVEVGALAYKKIVYHLIRYPTSKVCGALVGTEDRKITNAYPLFHTPIVNPTFSVALDLIESNLAQNEKLIGFYEFVEGGECKINNLIENNPAFKSMIPMRVYMDSQRQIKAGAKQFVFTLPPFDSLKQGLKKGEYRFLVDFDAHFEEVELDFTNKYLN